MHAHNSNSIDHRAFRSLFFFSFLIFPEQVLSPHLPFALMTLSHQSHPADFCFLRSCSFRVPNLSISRTPFPKILPPGHGQNLLRLFFFSFQMFPFPATIFPPPPPSTFRDFQPLGGLISSLHFPIATMSSIFPFPSPQ